MAKKSKVTSAKLAKLASKVLKGYEPTRDEIEALAGSVMGQREKEIAEKKKTEAEPEPAVEAPVAEATVEVTTEEATLELTEEEKKGFWSNLFKR